MKVKDLKSQLGTQYPRRILKCVVCHDEQSANRDDYFAADPEHVFTCCDRPMRLVVKETAYREVRP